jgi:elongation factor P hydroxylase
VISARRSDYVARRPGHCAHQLEQVFARCFEDAWQTVLRGGAEEPLYQPADSSHARHTIYYRDDYFASALHEVAHWCIAGPCRRTQVDFGYWYASAGRSNEQQRAFEVVESGPQALEWFFSCACDWPFRVSADNLDPANGVVPDTTRFRKQIAEQVNKWQACGLPARADLFYRALCQEYGTALQPDELCFNTAEIL